MSAQQITSLIQRKARSGREAQAERAMSLGRALRLSAAKQAEQMMGLAVAVVGVTRRTIAQGQLGDCLDADALMLVMDGTDGQGGAAVLDAALVAGLVQHQIMGKIAPVIAGAPQRRSTATDAALCAPLVEGLLTRAGDLPDDQADAELLTGYRFGVWAKEPRQVQLVLDAADFEAIELTLDLAAGAGSGKLTLLLPHRVAEAPPEDVQTPPEGKAVTSGGRLAGNVMGLHAELTIALTRMKMPLQQVRGMKVGEVLDLGLKDMTHALILDSGGRAISRGTLGQIDGMRAVQVEQLRVNQHTEPRRRASDRADLDLPDVTLPLPEAQMDRRAQDKMAPEDQDAAMVQNSSAPRVPSLADVDVFGDLGDMSDLPDIAEAEKAADAQMSNRQSTQGASSEDDNSEPAQAVW
jgi:flagellar motor switch/type III secretory pathway protein FliN